MIPHVYFRKDSAMRSIFFAYFFAAACVALSARVNENLEYLGRFDLSGGVAKAVWPGTGIKLNLVTDKDAVSITVNYSNCVGSCNFYVEAEVNCATYDKFLVTPSSPQIVLNLDTASGNSLEVSFIKITESSNGNAAGVMEIGDVVVEGASAVKKNDFLKNYRSNCPKLYKMLVVGDSITAAYGAEGAMPCTFSASTENSNVGYATVVAKSVGAELHLVPWSGKGVVRNYGDKSQMSAEPMPLFYNRTLSTSPISDANYWDPSQYQPDVVLVTLGTNDYSTDPVPEDSQFVNGLVDLLTVIQKDYPNAQVAAACAPMRRGNQCTNIATAAGTAGVHYVDIDPSTLNGGYGCDGHPNVVDHQLMADLLMGYLRKMLKLSA